MNKELPFPARTIRSVNCTITDEKAQAALVAEAMAQPTSAVDSVHHMLVDDNMSNNSDSITYPTTTSTSDYKTNPTIPNTLVDVTTSTTSTTLVETTTTTTTPTISGEIITPTTSTTPVEITTPTSPTTPVDITTPTTTTIEVTETPRLVAKSLGSPILVQSSSMTNEAIIEY